MSCRVVSRTPSKAVRVGAWLASGRAREPEPPRLVQLAAGLQPQAGSSCLIHGSRPFVPHPNLYIPRPPPIRWQMVPRLHSPHPIDASKKTAARRAHTDDGKHVVARARGSGGRRNVAEWGGVCASRSARHCFSSHPVQHGWSKPHRWPNLAFRQPSNDNDGWDCKKGSDARAAGGRLSKQAKNAVSGGYGWARGFDGGGYVKATIQTEP